MGDDYVSPSAMGVSSAQGGTRGVSQLSFLEENGQCYLNLTTHEYQSGLDHAAVTLPFAQKKESMTVSQAAADNWQARTGKIYFGASEPYFSARYMTDPIATWFQVDSLANGQSRKIDTPAQASWFANDNKMNCIASSLKKSPRDAITLPEDEYIIFVGENAVFSVSVQ